MNRLCILIADPLIKISDGTSLYLSRVCMPIAAVYSQLVMSPCTHCVCVINCLTALCFRDNITMQFILNTKTPQSAKLI